MTERKHSRRQTETGRGLSRMIIIILTAAAVCILFVMAGHMYREKKELKNTADSNMEKNAAKTKTVSKNRDISSKIETGVTEAAETTASLRGQISSMTLEEKIAQMFIITPEALTGFDQVTDAGEATKNALLKYPVGGLVYFKANIQNPQQLKEMISDTKKYAAEAGMLPILTAVDEEGGSVARIAGNPEFAVERFPDMAEIGTSGDLDRAYEVGNTIGGYLKDYGFNLDFAPDADVLTNPDNKVVSMRSFGPDPQLVSAMAGQVAAGLMNQNIIPVYKHFPGHGSTKGDTHEGFAYTDRTLEELRGSELAPFADAVKNGIPCIMAAHIAAVNIDGNTPASLSKTLITGVLREELGFDRVVITDAMNMGAIQNMYSSGDAAILAVEAGADLLLMPADFQEAYDSLLNAVKKGRISEDRIDESLMRIAAMKEGL